MIKLITLTHANLKEKMDVVAGLIGGFYHSPGHKCTHVVMNAGAIFPAAESVDDIRRLLTGQEAQKEVNNGISGN